MDIRTKLALALVSVSLLSMAILGVFAYHTSAGLLQEISVRQLDALAESKKQDLVKVYEGWQDQLRLIRSTSRLPDTLQVYLQNRDAASLDRIEDTIRNAVVAVSNVEHIAVFSLEGDEIASFGDAPSLRKHSIPQNMDEVRYAGAHPGGGEDLQVSFSTLLSVEGRPVGALNVIIDAHDLFSVTSNYTGLGDTGEIMVVRLTDDGTATVLNPLRHENGSASLGDTNLSPDVKAVLEGEERVFTGSVEDYRGVDVWSATRFIPGLEWGLIVKVDAAEEETRAIELRDALVDIALALSAFAIIGGTLLGLYLARPIHDLVEIVTRVRKGETDLRADVRGDDEIAYLADSLNELMDSHIPSEQDHKNTDA